MPEPKKTTSDDLPAPVENTTTRPRSIYDLFPGVDKARIRLSPKQAREYKKQGYQDVDEVQKVYLPGLRLKQGQIKVYEGSQNSGSVTTTKQSTESGAGQTVGLSTMSMSRFNNNPSLDDIRNRIAEIQEAPVVTPTASKKSKSNGVKGAGTSQGKATSSQLPFSPIIKFDYGPKDQNEQIINPPSPVTSQSLKQDQNAIDLITAYKKALDEVNNYTPELELQSKERIAKARQALIDNKVDFNKVYVNSENSPVPPVSQIEKGFQFNPVKWIKDKYYEAKKADEEFRAGSNTSIPQKKIRTSETKAPIASTKKPKLY